jgi:drug/metabolite transporter (DMT)-like permease
MMTVIIIPFTLNRETINSVMHLSTKGWLAILFLGIFCSGIAYVLWAQALKELEAAKAGVFLYFEPFVTVFAAWLLLHEVISFITILSGIIITSGVILVNKKKF